MKFKKTSVLALAGLLAVAAVGGSYAFWNQTSTIDNPFDTGKYGSTVTEDFKPDDGEKWQPGAEVNKDVFAVNTGDTDLIVRVKLDETWTRKDTDSPYKTNLANTGDVYAISQAVENDGLTAADKSVVNKNFSDSTNWVPGGDGWFYYKTNLPGGATTDKWLESVELLNNVDMGKMVTTYYLTTDETITDNSKWFTYTGKMPAYVKADGTPCDKDAAGALMVRHNKTEVGYASANEYGYSNSDYDLKVTVQTIQPTQEAIDAVFGAGSAFTAPTGTAWTIKN